MGTRALLQEPCFNPGYVLCTGTTPLREKKYATYLSAGVAEEGGNATWRGVWKAESEDWPGDVTSVYES